MRKFEILIGIGFIMFALGSDVAAQTCLDCHDGGLCSEGQHYAGPQPPGPGWGDGDGSHPTECKTGTCLLIHGVCGGFARASAIDPSLKDLSTTVFARVAAAVSSNDLSEITRLMRLVPDNIIYYRPRNALQVRDCTGRVLGNYRLNFTQGAVVAASIDNRILATTGTQIQ